MKRRSPNVLYVGDVIETRVTSTPYGGPHVLRWRVIEVHPWFDVRPA